MPWVHPDRESNPRLLDGKSDVLTVAPPTRTRPVVTRPVVLSSTLVHCTIKPYSTQLIINSMLHLLSSVCALHCVSVMMMFVVQASSLWAAAGRRIGRDSAVYLTLGRCVQWRGQSQWKTSLLTLDLTVSWPSAMRCSYSLMTVTRMWCLLCRARLSSDGLCFSPTRESQSCSCTVTTGEIADWQQFACQKCQQVLASLLHGVLWLLYFYTVHCIVSFLAFRLQLLNKLELSWVALMFRC